MYTDKWNEKNEGNKCRSAIDWHSVIAGIYLQFAIGAFVLRTDIGNVFFSWLSIKAGEFLESRYFFLAYNLLVRLNKILLK
jgi:hypothetical protein